MKKRWVCMTMAAVLAVSLSGCAGTAQASETEPKETKEEKTEIEEEEEEYAKEEEKADAGEKKTIAFLLPEKETKRWERDASSFQEAAEENWEVHVDYAQNDAALQEEQVKEQIEQGVDALVIAPVDAFYLAEALEEAKEKEIPVIAYDRLIMNTDAVSYYVSFNNREEGKKIGRYIEEAKELKKAQEAGESYTIEFLSGSPEDNNALFLFNGILEILQPYLDDGTLLCKSGRTTFDDTSIMDWDVSEAAKRMEESLESDYSRMDSLDIVCTAYDGYAEAAAEELQKAGYEPGSEAWPMITGQDCEETAVERIAAGTQTMSVFKDARELADRCAAMLKSIFADEKVEVNNKSEYDNGVKIVSSYCCETVLVDKDNYQVLFDNGYYQEEDVTLGPMPALTEQPEKEDRKATPTPEENKLELGETI